MAQASIKNKIYDGQDDFDGGCDSFSELTSLPENQVHWLYNCITRGKNLFNRPGQNVVLRLGCGKAQGLTLFQPTNGNVYLVFAISGLVYASGFPFTAVQQIPNIVFDSMVDHVAFKEALVAVDSLGNPIAPYAVLMMQDGRHRAAYWDGNVSRHLDPTPDGFYSPSSIGANETPIGLWMEWIGSRLWVAQGRRIFASDIFNPLLFTENQYLSSGGSFQAMDGAEITGLKKTADNKQLLVFTQSNTTSIAASITNRSTWGSTPDFVSLWFPGVGCVGGKAILVHNGEVHWMSAEGWRIYNQVGTAVRYSKSGISSHEMFRSYNNMSPWMSRCCGGSFGSYAMMGTPSGDILNHHTWVLDTSSSDLLNSIKPYSWQGVWVGIRPVEFASGFIYREKRCFALSQDYDGFVRIWEMFDKTGLDEGQRITWFCDSRGHNFKQDGQGFAFKKLSYMEFYMENIEGLLDFGVSYKTEFSCLNQLAQFSLCAQDCMDLDITQPCKPSKALNSQSRYRRTPETNYRTCGEGGAPHLMNTGTYIVARLIGNGRGGINKYRLSGEVYEEEARGTCRGENDKICIPLSCCNGEPTYYSIFENHDYDYYYGGVDSPCDIVLV